MVGQFARSHYSLGNGHFKGIGCQAALERCRYLPSYDCPLKHVCDEGNVGPADLCLDVGVGSGQSAFSAFQLLGFSGPPSEPDLQLSPHPALHKVMSVVQLMNRAYLSMAWGS